RPKGYCVTSDMQSPQLSGLARLKLSRVINLPYSMEKKSNQVSDVYPVVYAERGDFTLRWLAAHGSLVRRS
ncbi:hypothetical protein J6590_089373, partial [Homalodisca vitripennis]